MTSPAPCLNHRNGVKLGDGSCLVLRVSVLISQSEASKKCQRLGGHLASVHNKDMNEVILRRIINDRSFLKRNIWIGLKKVGKVLSDIMDDVKVLI